MNLQESSNSTDNSTCGAFYFEDLADVNASSSTTIESSEALGKYQSCSDQVGCVRRGLQVYIPVCVSRRHPETPFPQGRNRGHILFWHHAWTGPGIVPQELQDSPGFHACLAIGTQVVSKGTLHTGLSQGLVLIVLAVLRLPAVASDLLVSLNVSLGSPSQNHVSEQPEGVRQEARESMLAMLASLQIRDWGLFG